MSYLSNKNNHIIWSKRQVDKLAYKATLRHVGSTDNMLCWMLSRVCLFCDCSLPGSSVHGIFQPRMLEWVAISFSRGSSWPRDWTWVSCLGRWILYHWVMREAPWVCIFSLSLVFLKSKGRPLSTCGSLKVNMTITIFCVLPHTVITQWKFNLHRTFHNSGNLPLKIQSFYVWLIKQLQNKSPYKHIYGEWYITPIIVQFTVNYYSEIHVYGSVSPAVWKHIPDILFLNFLDQYTLP